MTITIINQHTSAKEMAQQYINAVYGVSLAEFGTNLERDLKAGSDASVKGGNTTRAAKEKK